MTVPETPVEPTAWPSTAAESTAPPASTLLTGKLRPTIFMLALPVLAEQFFAFLVGFFDIYLSGQISSAATSAVGLAAYVSWLVSLIYSLVAVGATALVARFWGAGEYEQANRVANRAIALTLSMSLAAFLIAFLSAPFWCTLLALEGETRDIAVRYLRFECVGFLAMGVSMAAAAALRGVGNMKLPMLIFGSVSVLNVLFSTALVFGSGPFPQCGIDGIVIGTIIARWLGGAAMLVALLKGVNGLKLVRRELKCRGETVRRLLRVGMPAALDGILHWGGHFLFLMIISRVSEMAGGSAIFAAHIVSVELEAITYLPAVAWGCAASTMIGQSLGAGLAQRAKQVGHESTAQCSLLAVWIMLAFFLCAGPIFGLMHSDPQVQAVGTSALRWLAFFQPPLVVSIVYVYALRGAGDTRTPLIVNTAGIYLIRLPIAYLGGVVLDGGLLGAWAGMFADIVVRALLIFVFYVRGRWIDVSV